MLRKRVEYFKENLEGVKEMCRISEEIFNEGVEQGREQGLFDDVRKLVANLGMSVRDALDALEVPEEDREWYLAMLGETNPSR